MDQTIAQAIDGAKRGHERLLKTFTETPDDKINFAPSATSRSAHDIVVHIAQSNKFMSKSICGESLPAAGSLEDFDKFMKEASAGITTRAQALAILDESMSELMSALECLTPADLGKEVVLPFATLPLAFFIFVPGMHMGNHASQIDYIQTIYGDMANHM